MTDGKGILIDFGLPALTIVACTVLLMTGHDSEVKAVLTIAAGWIFHSGYTRNEANRNNK